MVADPRKASETLNSFMGGTLDSAAMERAVDPSLQREGR
jgi:hypothetical protein